MEIVFAERAQRDIAEIYDTLAEKNPAAALRVESLIREKCYRLSEFPRAAFATDEPDVYRLPLVRYPYAIFYRLDLALKRSRSLASFTVR